MTVISVGDDLVYEVCQLICVFLVAGLVSGLLKRSMYEAVLGIHDDCFAVVVGIVLHISHSLVAYGEYFLSTTR